MRRKASAVLASLLLPVAVAASDPPAGAKPASRETAKPPEVAAADSRREEIGDELLLQLLSIRRVHVEKLGGGETAGQIRDMVIAGLQAGGVFILTEDPARADAILRGSAEDLVFTENFSSGEGVNARATLGIPTDSSSSRYSNRLGLSAGYGENDEIRKTERKHEAVASLRLLNKDGDVIWSATEESGGGKFRGASADVADKIARRLLEAYQKALRRKAAGVGGSPALP